MTAGEKAIWAAAYAKYYDISSPPAAVVHDTKKWQEWESAQVHVAIEFAGGAVERAREELSAIRKAFGANSSTYKLLAEMVG